MFIAENVLIGNLPSVSFDQIRKPVCFPSCAAIYFVVDDDEVVYVSKTIDLRQKWIRHPRFDEASQLNQVSGNVRIAWMEVSEAGLLSEIKETLIKHFLPKLNKSPGRRPGGLPIVDREVQTFENFRLNFDTESVDRFVCMNSCERAKKTGLSQATWSRWISGDRSPTLETIKNIAPKLEMGYVELTLGLMVLRQELSAA